ASCPPPDRPPYTIRLPCGDQPGLTHLPSASRTGARPSTGILNSAEPCASRPPATLSFPSGDHAAAPWPAAPSISIDAANVLGFVPSAERTTRWRLPAFLTTTAS